MLSSCSKNLDNLITPVGEPLVSVEVSEGNVWLPTTVLPDTGDKTHYVSTQCLTVDKDNNIYVGTDFAGLFKSSDDGKSWTVRNNGFL